MIGDRRMLFEKKFTVYTEFAKLGELQPGAIVRVAGAKAGEVTDIATADVAGAASSASRWRSREDLHPLVRTDSVATIADRRAGRRHLRQHRDRH